MNNTINAILEYCSKFYQKNEFPALHHQMTIWEKSRPLDGMRLLDSTPLYTNTLLKYIPLLAAGAKLTVATSDNVPFDATLPARLKEWGISCQHNIKNQEFDCILDCAGAHAHLTPKYGVAELTRSGLYHYQNAGYPVILVDDSRIKAIETCLGTGDGFLRGMQQLGYADFHGKSIVIFGYGKVGRGIAFYAQKEGAKITVIDLPGTSVPEDIQFIASDQKDRIARAVETAWCVVTATGIKDAMIGNGAAEILRHGRQLIAAMGIENEWGDSLPPERILNHGIALNFRCQEPTRLRYIDPTMALSNAAALEIVTQQTTTPGIQKIAQNIEDYYWHIVETQGLIAQDVKAAKL